ncbi:MAG: hypothetical protein IJ532_07455 [Alphaproteobacteria bacterium]|nr:hypothetical protein [Alphaproteobacteria bacterium]
MIRNIYILYEQGLEVLKPHIEDAVEQMMDCFPRHKANYPITTLGNWHSDKAEKMLPNGNILLEPYESVDWYIANAKLKAMEQNRWQTRGQISIDQLYTDLSSDPYCKKIPQWSVLVTKHDLYADGLNFCLGVSKENAFSIVSTARFIDRNNCLDVEGFKTVVMHEFGHLIGLTHEGRANTSEQLGSHCTNDGCIMQQRMDGDFRDITRVRLAAKKLYGLPPICSDCIESGEKFFTRQQAVYDYTHGILHGGRNT